MKNKMLFLYNPKSGKTQIRTKLAEVVEIFSNADYEVTIHPTKAKLDAYNKIKKDAAKYDIVVCSGGDGTLDEVVRAMMKKSTKCPIGYIPSGSTNDFANSMKIPKNIKKAAEEIVDGKLYSCDVGRFNEDNFIYIAAFGLFTDVSYETNQEAKNVLGHLAYVLEGVKRLSMIQSYRMRIEYENKFIEDDFIFGMVTNSLSVGGFKRITGKNVEMDDGKFEVTLIKKPENPIEFNRLMAALVNRDIDTKSMYCFKTSKIRFFSKGMIPWTLDGEFGGEHREVFIENQKRALDFIIKLK